MRVLLVLCLLLPAACGQDPEVEPLQPLEPLIQPGFYIAHFLVVKSNLEETPEGHEFDVPMDLYFDDATGEYLLSVWFGAFDLLGSPDDECVYFVTETEISKLDLTACYSPVGFTGPANQTSEEGHFFAYVQGTLQ